MHGRRHQDVETQGAGAPGQRRVTRTQGAVVAASCPWTVTRQCVSRTRPAPDSPRDGTGGSPGSLISGAVKANLRVEVTGGEGHCVQNRTRRRHRWVSREGKECAHGCLRGGTDRLVRGNQASGEAAARGREWGPARWFQDQAAGLWLWPQAARDSGRRRPEQSGANTASSASVRHGSGLGGGGRTKWAITTPLECGGPRCRASSLVVESLKPSSPHFFVR